MALLKQDQLVVLETQKKHSTFKANIKEHTLKKTSLDTTLFKQTISYYQTAFDLFKKEELKTKNTSKK